MIKSITTKAQFASLILLMLLSALMSPVYAQTDRAATPQVAASLIASVAQVQPGVAFYVGVHQKIIPHWHTYWVNPGDSGNATSIVWTLPDGAHAGEIIWPSPSRFSMGPITNYAYENEVTLVTQITPPANLHSGDSFKVHALVDWLVCQEECIPQQVELVLELPIAAGDAPVNINSSGDAQITQALAQVPIASPWAIQASQTSINPDTAQGELSLEIALSAEQRERVSDIWFYPYDWGRIQQSAQQQRLNTDDGIRLRIPTGEAPLNIGELLTGVLVIRERASDDNNSSINRGFEVMIPLQSAAVTSESSIGFWAAILLALVGGVILNLMPCVFPVLSIKALSLVSHANQSAAQIRAHGVMYTFGVLVSFALLAVLLILLKAGGAQIGWGFQFQSPLFVLLVAYLMFAVGLSLSGVFFIGGSVAGVGSSLTEKPGYGGSFFTGVLATIVATPCTAPFMAAALGYALAQPAVKLLAIFLSLGLGLALPYLLLTCWPRLQRWLPKPGAWMELAKQVLAFPMYAAAIWLVWVLVQQAGVNAVVIALGGMLLIAIAAWLYSATAMANGRARLVGNGVALILILAALYMGYAGVNQPASGQLKKAENIADKNWEAFSDERLAQLLAEGKPVFLNFTASWCISCLVNERVALSDESVKDAFKKEGIVYLKGDWTNRDQTITQFLQKFNRSGVPLYVFYPAGKPEQPVELSQILTPNMVISAVTQAQ
ncbi:protein-disulfide reductase DsbD family protein [Cellvibrio sp. NN19]|uniref:protein-disulfide reductase DsbD family protein n=1 Tax=Cellvibrio chitinivorans TaxID=3102792 RepID=UPI002B41547C|nr:thioredoxin family protein [Cellvibrio sp. NN19]